MPPTWTWLSSKPSGVLVMLSKLQTPESDAFESEKAATAVELPLILRCVVFVMELALVGGATFLLLLMSSVLGNVLQKLLTAIGDEFVSKVAVVKICETAAFGWGLVAFMSWFFQRPKRELVQRLTGSGWSNAKSCVLSVLLHSMAIISLILWQHGREDQALMSMINVHSALIRPDGSLATVEILQTLLLAPAKEELFFRGVIVLVTINRFQSPKLSAALSSVLFAAIHLANARQLGTHYSTSYLTFQVVWALLVGMFLALKFAVSGSLIECFVLHMINNIFALSVSKQVVVDMMQPLVLFSVVTALAIYVAAIARQLQRLNHTFNGQVYKK